MPMKSRAALGTGYMAAVKRPTRVAMKVKKVRTKTIMNGGGSCLSCERERKVYARNQTM
jgi:hypothetical protein